MLPAVNIMVPLLHDPGDICVFSMVSYCLKRKMSSVALSYSLMIRVTKINKCAGKSNLVLPVIWRCGELGLS